MRCFTSCSASGTFPRSKSRAVASSRAVGGSSTCSRRRASFRSGSSSSATRSTPCAPSIPPTNAVSRPSIPSSCSPQPSSSSRRTAPTRSVPASVAPRRACRSVSRRISAASRDWRPRNRVLRGFLATGPRRRARRGPSTSATRRSSGPGCWRRRPASTTCRRGPCSCSTSPVTSPTPPTSCGARRTSDMRS